MLGELRAVGQNVSEFMNSCGTAADAAKAQLMFYNAQGKLIQTLDLATRGAGSLNVFAHDLSTGTYTYMLLIDGEVKATRKMILSK